MMVFMQFQFFIEQPWPSGYQVVVEIVGARGRRFRIGIPGHPLFLLSEIP